MRELARTASATSVCTPTPMANTAQWAVLMYILHIVCVWCAVHHFNVNISTRRIKVVFYLHNFILFIYAKQIAINICLQLWFPDKTIMSRWVTLNNTRFSGTVALSNRHTDSLVLLKGIEKSLKFCVGVQNTVTWHFAFAVCTYIVSIQQTTILMETVLLHYLSGSQHVP